MLLSWSLFILALGGLTFAAPSRRANYVVHEKRAAEPSPAWVQSRRLESDKILPMRFGLTQSNLDKVEDILMAVSHPHSADYGKHLSPTEVIEMFKPSSETIEAVKNWLIGSGISPERIRLSGNKGWIELNATVAEAEDLLDTEYHVYEHEESGLEQISCHSYSLPAHVQPHIELVKPTVHFNHRVARDEGAPGKLKRKRESSLGKPSPYNGPKTNGEHPSVAPSLDSCDEYITPACLRALYNIYYVPTQTGKNTYGVVEFTPQAYLPTDLDMFFSNYSPSLVGTRPVLVSIDGGYPQAQYQGFDYNGESDLDFEYAMSLVTPQNVTLLQTGDMVEGAGFDNWLDAVDASFCTYEGGDDPSQDGIYPDTAPGGYNGPESCGIIAPPYVVSTSYGQDEFTATPAYAIRQCNEYAKLGMMGTTVLYASGDYGVAGFGGECIDTATNTESVNGTRFNPDFPATCPYVTAVGATQVSPGYTVYEPESAAETVIYSGGGFSNIFAMPSYQAAAVTHYLEAYPPPYTAAQYNNSGNVRAFPDLAANGVNYVIAIDGEFELVYGTSASSPVVGSMITLVNDARLGAGKGPVGFLNPVIYTPGFASAFHDITNGSNQGCGTVGFTTEPGWDPVTGVGTPDLTILMPMLLGLP
ncbi:subtilisin-like protein [Gloeophyllum trabeum ATCC 11539]|uniref:tripeptidyl-peptidase II n=1 Tax=Gloeophyllum trabeum (strain ATCC 11539 / FP-39264 / Madison 617) TaxID=670483 RepID=S7Q5Y2_GLOTA|nr:subtilisin-like protein [Gloeophyllum trabeum ATCC 11539]EPQ54887.1 subtilisin-like protein [Gloeophyllum trabeum ATCC 11539]